MTHADIQIQHRDQIFHPGDSVCGVAFLTVPTAITFADVSISFHVVGKVKWTEFTGDPYDMTGFDYYDTYDYHHEFLNILSENIKEISQTNEQKRMQISFASTIPNDKNLPSTMKSADGFIQYYFQVEIKEAVHKFTQEIIVEAPMEKDLMVTVGGSAEKHVLLHGGNVSLQASIGRKGFAPGETITVHVSVNNETNVKVIPRLTLSRIQIFMCEVRHKTIETSLNETPISGTEVDAHSRAEEVLAVCIPSEESLSIKSPVITVKYFVRVTLDIPHSFDLHVNLPVVLTSANVIQQLRGQGKNLPEIA